MCPGRWPRSTLLPGSFRDHCSNSLWEVALTTIHPGEEEVEMSLCRLRRPLPRYHPKLMILLGVLACVSVKNNWSMKNAKTKNTGNVDGRITWRLRGVVTRDVPKKLKSPFKPLFWKGKIKAWQQNCPKPGRKITCSEKGYKNMRRFEKKTFRSNKAFFSFPDIGASAATTAAVARPSFKKAGRRPTVQW